MHIYYLKQIITAPKNDTDAFRKMQVKLAHLGYHNKLGRGIHFTPVGNIRPRSYDYTIYGNDLLPYMV